MGKTEECFGSGEDTATIGAVSISLNRNGEIEDVELYDRLELDLLGFCNGEISVGEIVDIVSEEGEDGEEVWEDVRCRIERLFKVMLLSRI